MTDHELLEAMYRDMQDMKQEMREIRQDVGGLKQDVAVLKQEVGELKQDVAVLKQEVGELKQDVAVLKHDMKSVKQRVTAIELTLENETNHNIQLLAENHISLVNKLNEAIKVQDKSILYEVQVSGLKMKVEKLEKEVEELKAKIA